MVEHSGPQEEKSFNFCFSTESHYMVCADWNSLYGSGRPGTHIACLCFPTAGIRELYHHTWQEDKSLKSDLKGWKKSIFDTIKATHVNEGEVVGSLPPKSLAFGNKAIGPALLVCKIAF